LLLVALTALATLASALVTPTGHRTQKHGSVLDPARWSRPDSAAQEKRPRADLRLGPGHAVSWRRSDPQSHQFAVKGPAVRRGSIGGDDAQPSVLDGDTSDLVVALPVREQRDVDAMGDGPIADIDSERPGVGDEVPGHFLVVVVGAALRITGRDQWSC
jgi:hypothetical protein